MTRENIELLNLVYKYLAKDIELFKEKVLLIEDNARWHNNKKRKIYSGIIREYLSACYPKLEQTERRYTLLDQP